MLYYPSKGPLLVQGIETKHTTYIFGISNQLSRTWKYSERYFTTHQINRLKLFCVLPLTGLLSGNRY